jgi:hypothetical protein
MALIVVTSNLISCKSEQIRPFPTHEIYEVIRGEKGCTVYKVIRENPITVDGGTDLDEAHCPRSISGFHYQEVPEVFDWIRDAQELAKKNCN